MAQEIANRALRNIAKRAELERLERACDPPPLVMSDAELDQATAQAMRNLHTRNVSFIGGEIGPTVYRMRKSAGFIQVCDCPGCVTPRTHEAKWRAYYDLNGNYHCTSLPDPFANAIAFSNPSNAIGKRYGTAQCVRE